MAADFSQQLRKALGDWWREQAQTQGTWRAGSRLLLDLCAFVRDSTRERRRARYGDMDYDWEHRVNTTSGTVRWRERLLGVFHSPYQPTDPAAFREMMAALPIDFREFTFIDIGSGKGRTLLMASDYPFRKIVGVELIFDLHRIAETNIAAYRPRSLQTDPKQDSSSPGAPVESICVDARDFVFPETPLVVYLFNPLPEARLRRVRQNLEHSWKLAPRPMWVVYHHPVLEAALTEPPWLQRVGGTEQYSLYLAK